MANSVDPDQTAPSGWVWSGSALFAYAILSENFGVQNLRTFTIWYGVKMSKIQCKYDKPHTYG